MTKGFKLIQTVGLLGMDFESTQGYTLEFEESKTVILSVIKFIKENGNIDELEAEVFSSELGKG